MIITNYYKDILLSKIDNDIDNIALATHFDDITHSTNITTSNQLYINTSINKILNTSIQSSLFLDKSVSNVALTSITGGITTNSFNVVSTTGFNIGDMILVKNNYYKIQSISGTTITIFGSFLDTLSINDTVTQIITQIHLVNGSSQSLFVEKTNLIKKNNIISINSFITLDNIKCIVEIDNNTINEVPDPLAPTNLNYVISGDFLTISWDNMNVNQYYFELDGVTSGYTTSNSLTIDLTDPFYSINIDYDYFFRVKSINTKLKSSNYSTIKIEFPINCLVMMVTDNSANNDPKAYYLTDFSTINDVSKLYRLQGLYEVNTTFTPDYKNVFFSDIYNKRRLSCHGANFYFGSPHRISLPALLDLETLKLNNYGDSTLYVNNNQKFKVFWLNDNTVLRISSGDAFQGGNVILKFDYPKKEDGTAGSSSTYYTYGSGIVHDIIMSGDPNILYIARQSGSTWYIDKVTNAQSTPSVTNIYTSSNKFVEVFSDGHILASNENLNVSYNFLFFSEFISGKYVIRRINVSDNTVTTYMTHSTHSLRYPFWNDLKGENDIGASRIISSGDHRLVMHDGSGGVNDYWYPTIKSAHKIFPYRRTTKLIQRGLKEIKNRDICKAKYLRPHNTDFSNNELSNWKGLLYGSATISGGKLILNGTTGGAFINAGLFANVERFTLCFKFKVNSSSFMPLFTTYRREYTDTTGLKNLNSLIISREDTVIFESATFTYSLGTEYFFVMQADYSLTSNKLKYFINNMTTPVMSVNFGLWVGTPTECDGFIFGYARPNTFWYNSLISGGITLNGEISYVTFLPYIATTSELTALKTEAGL